MCRVLDRTLSKTNANVYLKARLVFSESSGCITASSASIVLQMDGGEKNGPSVEVFSGPEICGETMKIKCPEELKGDAHC